MIRTNAGGQGIGPHENKGREQHGQLKRKRREERVLKGCGAGEIGVNFTRILTISQKQGRKKSGSCECQVWEVGGLHPLPPCPLLAKGSNS